MRTTPDTSEIVAESPLRCRASLLAQNPSQWHSPAAAEFTLAASGGPRPIGSSGRRLRPGEPESRGKVTRCKSASSTRRSSFEAIRTLFGGSGRAVEDLGFDHLLAYDHVLGAVHADRTPPLTGPYTEHDPFHDPFVMFAYLAGITERIGFATGILILPQRQTALVARQAADVDLLSGGRLRLGVGVGWNHVEYEALGQDFRTRGARQEEQIELLRRLFTEPVVDFSGRFDRVDRAALVPKPARSDPDLAWWIRRRGVRPGRPARGRLHLLGGGIDHASTPGNGCAIAWTASAGRSTTSARTMWRSLGAALGGLTTKIDAWREAGGTHVSVVTMGLGLDSVDGHIDYLASVADALSLS